MNTKTNAPARHSEPTDEQLTRLMQSALTDARTKAAAADRALQSTVRAEAEKVRQRYLTRPRNALAVTI